MGSHIGSPKAMRPVNFRRGLGDFHSVAKQASFSIAFCSNFRGFGKPKSLPIFDFRAIFSDVIFGKKITSKFGSFLRAQNQKKNNFILEKRCFAQNQVFR